MTRHAVHPLVATDMNDAVDVVASFDAGLAPGIRADLRLFFGGGGPPRGAFWGVRAAADRLVGVVGLYDDPDRDVRGVSWMVWLFVRPDARGHGYGRALMRHALDDAVARQSRKVCLDVGNEKDHRSAIRLYEREGFERQAEMPDYFRPGQDKLVYTLDLASWQARRASGAAGTDSPLCVLFACPASGCHGRVQPTERHRSRGSAVGQGVLGCDRCSAQFPILGGVPVLVESLSEWLPARYDGILAALAEDDFADRGTARLVRRFSAPPRPAWASVRVSWGAPIRESLVTRLAAMPRGVLWFQGHSDSAVHLARLTTYELLVVADEELASLLAVRRELEARAARPIMVATTIGPRVPARPSSIDALVVSLSDPSPDALLELAATATRVLRAGGLLLATLPGHSSRGSAAHRWEAVRRMGLADATLSDVDGGTDLGQILEAHVG